LKQVHQGSASPHNNCRLVTAEGGRHRAEESGVQLGHNMHALNPHQLQIVHQLLMGTFDDALRLTAATPPPLRHLRHNRRGGVALGKLCRRLGNTLTDS